ncbi:MAG: site-2 protease family protein [Chitinophaga sp.]|uniref:site-2 protease family protein n=1 Tax=Chitinophaga sp. TaxID=1869181 RepID=UPI001B0B6819|nr:site-2 protease family protein [Chitinophaga sp.]MBO9729677.1 site-2 protease family protein [Chitinophaga sp.]
MKNSIKLFTLYGINIYVHWTFTLLFGGILILQYAGGAGWEQSLWTLWAIVAILGCVLLHELGHALAAAKFGIHSNNIILLPIGGMINMEKIPEHPIQEVIISLSGPLVNLLISGILALFIRGNLFPWNASQNMVAIQADNFLYYLYYANIVLAIFNLIPAFPMDGGRVLRGILALFTTSDKATTVAALTGRIIASAFIVAGIIFFNIMLMLIGLFIFVSGTSEEKLLFLKEAGKGILLKEIITRPYTILRPETTMIEAAEMLLYHQDDVFIIAESEQGIGVVSRDTILTAIINGKHQDVVRSYISEHSRTLQATATLTEAIDLLALNNGKTIGVAVNHQVKGAVKMQDIIEYLIIRNAHTSTLKKSSAIYKFVQAG